ALSSDAGSEDPGATPSADLEDLLGELEGLSLAKWESGNRGFSIHRLVQEIARARLPDQTRGPALLAAVELINAALPSDPPPSDVRAWPVWDPLRPHIEHLIHAADDAGIANPTARILNDLGQYLEAKGLLREAEPLMRRALAIDETSFGSEHPEVAIRLNNLASLLQ
ncbi:MAG: tetratricopeptide repeat protein, partial [Rhodobacteraceae bacterium]|nr:tetratricopeptide repeat protein [Paracoccaceae bacterium]